ncbi:hypothetical protein [Mesorhizobium sp. WSM4313]|uniref:hypothetical protein n=1 Tax=Mesorhizobium sp. WSM4313 TaxID=2029412 RepID=UPI001FD97FE5|nr:hypothetical protein [Mesorhizobium sp. WSM4313]
MPRYQVKELYGEKVIAGQTVDVDGPRKAAERVAGGPISSRALQEHWFRVIDEEESVVFEFSLAEPHGARLLEISDSPIDDPNCRAALRLSRATLEEHCPPRVLMREEQ